LENLLIEKKLRQDVYNSAYVEALEKKTKNAEKNLVGSIKALVKEKKENLKSAAQRIYADTPTS